LINRLSALLLIGCFACQEPIKTAPAPSLESLPPLPAGSLPDYGRLPDFKLVDQENAAFPRERLRGKIWISNFIFTTCAMYCPLLSARMGVLQRRLAESNADPALQLVSISIAPETDTPAVLKSYGARYRQDPARWSFLTGKTDPLQLAVTEAYKNSPPIDAKTGTATGFLALHGQAFELIDGDGRIRGYYPKSDAGLDAVLSDAKKLLASRDAGP
jgi:protein SCO1/2